MCRVEGAAGAMFTGSLSTNAVDGILSTYNSTPLVPFSPYNTTQVISPLDTVMKQPTVVSRQYWNSRVSHVNIIEYHMRLHLCYSVFT